MGTDLLDVIVRFHDPRRLVELDRCVFSVVTQSYAPVKAHIMCQRFTERDVAQVTEYVRPLLALNPGFSLEIINVEDPEPRDARSLLINRGISNAHGRYIAFLDYDDITYPDGYRLLISELAFSGYVIAFGKIKSTLVNVDDDVFRTETKRDINFQGTGVIDLLRENFCPIHSFVIDRTKISEHELFLDQQLSRLEDYDLLIRLCSRYSSSFKHQSTFVGEYYMKDDGSNTIILPSCATAERHREWDWSRAFLQKRRRETLVDPVVQRAIGIAKPDPALTVARLIELSEAS